jgi:hypothetical protein
MFWAHPRRSRWRTAPSHRSRVETLARATSDKQAQFFFESRLRNEPDPVADIHFTPGAPLGMLGGIGFIF